MDKVKEFKVFEPEQVQSLTLLGQELSNHFAEVDSIYYDDKVDGHHVWLVKGR